MNIQEAKTEIKNALRTYFRRDENGQYKYPAVRQRPILLMGPPGIGKTAIMEQAAQECGVGLVAYTITHHTRQSAIGLPRITSRSFEGRSVSVTEYTLSEIVASVYDCMERTGKKEGILFIDEINCVSETLAPTMLQLLQNKTFGNHRIPDGWLIVAAGNPPEYNRSVRPFDIVTLDRVRVLQLEADCETWLDYAREHNVHGAILSYLQMKQDRFYRADSMAEEQTFVTARGWEDLSELIKGYEELGLEVTLAQVSQYLHHKETAGDFAAYYQLYSSYGEDYRIPQLLAEEPGGALWERKQELLRRASFEERFIVIHLILDTLELQFRKYRESEAFLHALHEALLSLEEEEQVVRCLQERTQRFRESLEVKKNMELLRGEEARRQEEVLKELERYCLILKKEHAPDCPQAFERIRELFGERKAQRNQLADTVGRMLEHALAFVEGSCGAEEETLLLVSGLAKSSSAAEYITAYGSSTYLRLGEGLLGMPQQELQRACRELGS